MVFKTRKLLLLTAISFILTACGSSDSTIDSDVQRSAVDKISYYAQDSSNPVPDKQDYINAGVTNVSAVDIDELNALVANAEAKDVDTLDELNSLTRSLMDTTPPVITLNGASTISIALDEVYNELGATANDNKDGNINVVINKSAVVTSKVGTYTVIYTATDSSDNQTTLRRTVNVIEDLTPPVITISSLSSLKEESIFTATATAIDDKDGTVTVSIDSSKVDTSKLGTYDVVYSAVDKAGNVATKTQSVIVTALTVSDLFENSASGEFTDVTYIVVGDSTRNYSHDKISSQYLVKSDGYYETQLDKIDITFSHTAYSGQRVDYWKDNNSDGGHFIYNETKAKIAEINSRHCIVEFSMGINDFGQNNSDTKVKADLLVSIKKLKNDFPNLKILLVTPVPYYKADYDHGVGTSWEGSDSQKLEQIYSEVASEEDLELISGYEALNSVYSTDKETYYFDDWLHPRDSGSKVLVDYIFNQISHGLIQ